MEKKEEALYRHFEEIISEHFKQKKYDLVLNDFRALFHIKGFDTEFKYFALARTSSLQSRIMRLRALLSVP